MPAESGGSGSGPLPHTARAILILGGARSGKSTFAERLAQDLGEPILFVATAEALDEEMADRIATHQASRPASWITLEAPTNVGDGIRKMAHLAPCTILLDCVTLLVSNLLLGQGNDAASERIDAATVKHGVECELDDPLCVAREREANLVMVSNEVGLGLVPEYPQGRVYRDVLGRANQRLAAAADDVYLLVAGIPVVVKGRSWPT